MNTHFIKRITGFLFLVLFSLATAAQTKSNKGTEFWLGFMKHDEDTRAGMSLYITSDSNATGTVSIPGQNWSTTFSVTANSLTVVDVNVQSAYMDCSDCIEARGVKVVSDKDVIVYSHHYEGNKSDATLVLPSRTLGKKYYVMSYEEESEFIIVGVKDNTKVNITPSTAIERNGGGTRPANTTYQITLDQGEIYQGLADDTRNGDVTGTYIEVIDTGATANCRTVAVFSGNAYARLGNCPGGFGTFNSGDNLLEQMFPISSWGKNFVLVPAADRNSDDFKIMAAEDGTRVTVLSAIGAPTNATLDEGEVLFIDNEDQIRFATADKPVMVAQFQQQSRCDGRTRNGDPSMTILNPLEQTLKDITLYSSSFFDIDDHHINIVMPTFFTNTFTLDGAPVSWTAVPRKPNYSYARVKVAAGNHRLKADAGFIATAYGKGEFESYGYAAGANVKDLTAVADVVNSPLTNEISGCIGRPTEFKGEAEYQVVKWEWDFGDGNSDTVQNPKHTYADTGTYIAKLYTYKPSFDGCSNYDSSEVEVTIYDKPIARALWTPICEDATASFVDSSYIPEQEEYLFTRWIIDGNTRFSRSTSFSFDTVGKVAVFMEVSTTKQCKDTFVDSLIISPKPKAFFVVDDVCFYDSAYFTNQSSVSTGTIDSFFWRFSDGSATYFNENQVHFFSDSGYYDAELIVKTDSGCTASFDSFIYKHPRFDVEFSHVDTCFGLENELINTTVLEGGSYTDTVWYIGNSDTSYSYDATFTFDNPGTYTVQLVMEQNNYCKDTFEREINVDPIPEPDFSVENTCLGDETLFEDLSSIASGSYTIDWDFDDGQSGTFTKDTAVYSSGGIKTITLTLTSDQGCAADTTRDIIITYPEINSFVLGDICQDKSQIITSRNTLGLDSFERYKWEVNGVQVAADSIFTHTGTVLGKNYINLDVTTKNGCEISYNDSFEVFNSPRANFFITPVCLGQDVLPTDNSTIDAPGLITGYKWFVQGVEVSTDQNPIIPTTTSGSQDLMQVVESATGCSDTITKVIFVNPNPVNSFTTSNQCFGDITNFASTSTISSGAINTTIWTVEGTDRTGTSASETFAAPGDYSIRLITVSDNNCSDTLLQDVTIYPLPQLDITLAEYEGCIPFEISTVNNSTIASGSINSYQWIFGDGNVAQGANPSHTYPSPGVYALKVIATSDQGCIDSVDLGTQVTVHDLPAANFTFTPVEPSTITEFVTFNDSSQGNIINYAWSTSDGGMYSGNTVQHTFADSGTYSVSLLVEDQNGCTDEEVKLIYVNADLFVHIPTSFTPNGDLRNDTYGLGGLTQGVVELDMKIYNRWGELIFQSKDGQDRWDGTYKGEPVPQGVYVYLIRFTNPKRSRWYNYKGEIHLFR